MATTSVYPRVLRFLSWLSSCALAQQSVTHTKNFLSRARPAPATSSTPTRTQSSVGSRTRPANAGTHNPRGITRPAQDSSAYIKNNLKHLKRRDLQFKMYGCENIWLEILGKCQKVVIGVVYTWAQLGGRHGGRAPPTFSDSWDIICHVPTFSL